MPTLTEQLTTKPGKNDRSSRPPFGFNVCGFISGNFGLGFAARNTIRLLLENNFPVAVYDLPLAGAAGTASHEYDHLRSAPDNPFPYQFTVFHVNPPLLPQLSAVYRPFAPSRINVLVPFWELERAPVSWPSLCADIDLFLAPSRFIEQCLKGIFPPEKVRYYRQSYTLPGPIVPDRERFGIPADATVFFQSFDIASDIERKNPLATIHAFHNAFQAAPGVQLIMNVNVTNTNAVFLNAVAKLKEYVAAVPTIRIFDRPFGYAEVLTLCASCDVLVSLHRSEGLGLSLIEAMAMRKPVITTAYSGSMDFVSGENACLIPYSMIPAVSPFNPQLQRDKLGFDPFWADPDIDAAARCMRRLADDRGYRNSLGKNARKSIMRFLNESAKAEVFYSLQNEVNG